MIEPHFHCAECLKPIATTIKVAGGKTKPVDVQMGKQLMMVMTPQGPAAAERVVPLCDECAGRVQKKAEAAAASRLVIAQPGALRPV